MFWIKPEKGESKILASLTTTFEFIEGIYPLTSSPDMIVNYIRTGIGYRLIWLQLRGGKIHKIAEYKRAKEYHKPGYPALLDNGLMAFPEGERLISFLKIKDGKVEKVSEHILDERFVGEAIAAKGGLLLVMMNTGMAVYLSVTPQGEVTRMGEFVDGPLMLHDFKGKISEDGKFIVASSTTFNIFATCLEKSGKSYAQLLELVKEPAVPGERVALLKAAQRLKYLKVKNYLVAYSEVSAFTSDVASALIKLGADVALVAGNDDKVAKAKKIVWGASIGLAVILSSYAITSLVLRSLYDATHSYYYLPF